MVEPNFPANLENEKDLVEKAKTDDQSFEVLYDFYFPKVYGYLFKRLGHRETTEDLVSKTFLKIFTGLKKYAPSGCPFGAWVFRIATNNLIDFYRRQSQRREIDLADIAEPKDETIQIEAAIMSRQLQSQVRFVLQRLPEKDQKIIHLRYFAEMSGKEIAAILSLSESSVRVTLFRALKKFHKTYLQDKSVDL